MNGGNRGILIAMEGIDGTGKSTQLALLGRYLRGRGFPVIETREPTNGPYGRKIRELYVDRGKYSVEQELELFVEDRRQHVREVIEPALASGHIVLTDRYYFSTAAYQGAAGINPDEVFARNSFAPRPDLVIVLTMPPEISLIRIRESRGDQLNDFEQEDQLRRVAGLFESFDDPSIRRITADAPLEAVALEIRKTVDSLLQEKQYSCLPA
ncbi:MAG: dTMP kinase [Desulfobulbaceae bacterium]|jgi:dTMP kinase|nr:dTMP kinase [Desulfobulbaceae bacterium]MDY0351500.1 dTMP kinase [Desulfobulbaceae bacterium]